uniref:Ubiquitin-conjugating enzyme E2 G1 n=1 Tax=Hucho hucho TaxID=62062 RepID=A0A4W5LZ35_9TELE
MYLSCTTVVCLCQFLDLTNPCYLTITTGISLCLPVHSEGGVFKAHLTFPKDYPLRPPKMTFITDIWHPNVDKNGDVCISILHEPGEDKYGYEKPEERWLPIHTVETIMISVISMLADPNGDSPANVDAAKEWREDRHGEFKRKVARCVRKSQETAFE